MKKIISSLGILVVLLSFTLFSSCQKDAESTWIYTIGVPADKMEWEGSGKVIPATVVLHYLKVNGYTEDVQYTNKAKTTEDADKKNDEDAKRYFEGKAKKLKEVDFLKLCIDAGCISPSGKFVYGIWKDDKGRLAEITIKF
ncbi:MAG: hypothetical protein RRX93_05170 [Bacteroidales bacterium]